MGLTTSCVTASTCPRCRQWSEACHKELRRYVVDTSRERMGEPKATDQEIGAFLRREGHTPMVRCILRDGQTCKALNEIQ